MRFACALVTVVLLLLSASEKLLAQDSASNLLQRSFNYTILAGSKVTVFGSTNINEFSCFSEETWESPGPELVSAPLANKVMFKKAIVKIRTESLNCGNEVMDENLCSAMESDKFPYIIIELVDANSSNSQPIRLNGSALLTARVYITLAGTRRLTTISVNEKSAGDGIYNFTGNHELLLSDFGIVPPKALFGLIRVHDEISVKFDLIVSIQTASLSQFP